MRTVASLTGRLDMTAEEAVETLRYLFYDVAGVDSEIPDDLIDLLLDIDDDPKKKEKYHDERVKARQKEEQLAEKRKASLAKATAKKKADAKKKAAATKPAAKKKAASKKKAAAGEPEAEILPAKSVPRPTAEILAPDAAGARPVEERKEEGVSIVIGSAIEHDQHRAEIIRADGSHIDASQIETYEDRVAPAEPDVLPGPELGLLARAERDQEEEDKRKAKQKSAIKPDPKVVADVIRRAHEKKASGKKRLKERGIGDMDDEALPSRTAAHVPTIAPSAPRKTGKTARKRQKKMEKVRREEDVRRSAAAAIREYESGGMDAGIKKRRKRRTETDGTEVADTERRVVQVEDVMTVESLANAMGVDSTDIILTLMEDNILATKNQMLSLDTIRRVADAFEFEVESIIAEEEEIMVEAPDEPGDLKPRAPVVTVMGHVDHGKTSLLDRVRKASVAAGEAGGITQHIAAYEVNLPQGRVVFLDTPGHQAFTAMRARGAQVTDVVVLVVAADDGVMPQTREAIDHAKAAEVPIVVAINKCDKPNAQPERIRQQLMEFELVDEKWGGKTIMRDISALTGQGIDELMELLVLETELLELKANPDKLARGAVVEAEVTRGQGPVAWVLVRSGTLKVGDAFLCGSTYGRVRAMLNAGGQSLSEAPPSTPVVVLGFNEAPDAGDQFIALKDERVARAIAEKRAHRARMMSGPTVQHITLEDFHRSLTAGETTELRVVVKADVQGSADVLNSTLPELGNEEARVKIVSSGVGAINESDVLLASASNAVVLGFHVEPTAKAEQLAQSEGVEIRTYKIIYELTEELTKSLEGMLAPEAKETITGHAEVRRVFKSSALGNIAGCMQTDGEIHRDSSVRLLRNGKVVWDGRVGSLRREKDQVSSVVAGFECGIKLAGFDEIQEGDIIESFKVEQVARTLT